MPPNAYSRHRFSRAVVHRGTGRLWLEPRVPFRYRDDPEVIRHLVKVGDSWWSVAASYWAALPYAAQLWWVLPDFQPAPVVDPTIALEPGTLLYVPSLRMVTEQILSDARLLEEAAL